MKEKGISKTIMAAVVVVILIVAGLGAFFLTKPGAEEGESPSTEMQVYKGVYVPSTYPNYLASNIQKMKDMGVNTVFISAGSPDPEFPSVVENELTVTNVQTAHRDGLKVALTTGFTPPFPDPWEIDLENLNSGIIEAAKLAEEYGVEFFAPLDEPDCMFWENSARWGQEILPRVREVYHGEVIWKGAIFCFIDEMLSGKYPTDFSGYDYIGFSMSPRAGMTLEDYPQFVDNVLNATLAWAERDNCKGVMITEFGTWEWEPGYSEEDVARAHEIVLERCEDTVVGFFALTIPGEYEISGETEEVIGIWYKEKL